MKKKLPKFKSDQAESRFWNKHDLTEFYEASDFKVVPADNFSLKRSDSVYKISKKLILNLFLILSFLSFPICYGYIGSIDLIPLEPTPIQLIAETINVTLKNENPSVLKDYPYSSSSGWDELIGVQTKYQFKNPTNKKVSLVLGRPYYFGFTHNVDINKHKVRIDKDTSELIGLKNLPEDGLVP